MPVKSRKGYSPREASGGATTVIFVLWQDVKVCSDGSTEGASHRSGLNQALSRLLQRRKAYDGCAGVGGGYLAVVTAMSANLHRESTSALDNDAGVPNVPVLTLDKRQTRMSISTQLRREEGR